MVQMVLDNKKNMDNKDTIFDVNEADFAEKVIEKSNDVIILVDFWAPWCGPCKQLTPIIEEAIKEARGLAYLAKLNIDENQQIAAQLRIQSIPTVMAFHKKQIANAFQGVIPKTKIIDFIEKILGKPLPKNKEDFYKKIYKLIEKNNLDEAINSIEDFLSEDSNDVKTMSLYIDCLALSKKYNEVNSFVESLSENIINSNEIKKSIDKFKMLEKASKEPSLEILLSKYEEQPENIEGLIKLCDKYFFEKEYEQAFDLLVEAYSKLEEKNKEKIKKTLLKYFETLGNSHAQTKIYRRKLSSLLFS